MRRIRERERAKIGEQLQIIDRLRVPMVQGMLRCDEAMYKDGV